MEVQGFISDVSIKHQVVNKTCENLQFIESVQLGYVLPPTYIMPTASCATDD